MIDNPNEIVKPMFDLEENFKEVVGLINSLQEAVESGIERKMINSTQKREIIQSGRIIMQEVSKLLHGKWTPDILWMIYFLGNPYFNDIKNALPEINTRTLTIRLKSLEEKKLIKRIVHTGKPVRVSYSATEYGKGLTCLFIPCGIYTIL